MEDLQSNCTALDQSESNNFFMNMITKDLDESFNELTLEIGSLEFVC